MTKKMTKEAKKTLKIYFIFFAACIAFVAIVYGISVFVEYSYYMSDLVAEELIVGEEVKIVSPSSPYEGLVTVKSYYDITDKNGQGHGLKVFDIFEVLKESDCITQFKKDGVYIFKEDGQKFSSLSSSNVYVLQIFYEEKLVEEGQTLYQVLDGSYYIVVPSTPDS